MGPLGKLVSILSSSLKRRAPGMGLRGVGATWATRMGGLWGSARNKRGVEGLKITPQESASRERAWGGDVHPKDIANC